MRTHRFLILILSLVVVACVKDENIFVKGGPEISAFVEVQSFKQEQGLMVEREFEMRALNGLGTLTVYKDDALYDEVVLEEEGLIATYLLQYEVENVPDGTLITFRFELTDRQGLEAQPYSFQVEVGPPFAIESGMMGDLQVQVISGRINRDVTLTANETYLMDGLVSVEENKTLTIEAGTTIYMKTFSDGRDSRLAITRGSRISAEGTKDAPIVFTSDREPQGTANWGDWGGIFVYGRARTNQSANVFEEGFTYGGTNDTDNSGTLSYVRIEYTGKNDSDGFNFLGVGSGTRLSYLQVFNTLDNGIRFKGGAADLKYVVVIDHGAYGIWAEHGWRGRGQFWVFQTTKQATLIPVNFNNQARSVEFRNDPNNFLLQPATYVQLSNVTLIGNGTEIEDGTRRGFRIRRGAMGVIQNMIVTNFPDDGVRVEDVEPSKLEDGTMLLANVRAFANRANYDEQAEDYFRADPDFNVTEEAIPGISATSIVGSVPSNFNPNSLGSWFTSAPFIGAIENDANDWTADGSWCRGLDGNIR